MKKLLTTALFSVLCFANTPKEHNYKMTNSDILDMNQKYSYLNVKKELPTLDKYYLKVTGDKNYEQYLKEAVKDKKWKEANYIFTYKHYKNKITISGKTKKVNMPYYKQALQLFKESSEKGNILSSFQGYLIINKFFSLKQGNKIQKEFLPEFADKLYKKKYCIGYALKAKTSVPPFTNEKNYKDLSEMLDNGYQTCKKEEMDDYYVNELKFILSRFKALYILQQREDKRKGGRT